jgi:hypothetical protein
MESKDYEYKLCVLSGRRRVNHEDTKKNKMKNIENNKP